jgi:hypothetical protein
MTDDARAVRALTDVVAVEEYAPGMARVVTFSDAYFIDARGDGCACPDQQYNLGPGELCKHQIAAIIADSDHLPTPFVEHIEERPTALADGGSEEHSCGDCDKLPDSITCINTLDDPEVDA